MPLSFTPTSHEDFWWGTIWTIDDEDALAKIIARVAIGQSGAVQRILRATDASLPGYPKGGFQGARDLLLAEDGDDSYHRDGWVFQVISWIAAHLQDGDALVRAPHMIRAHKGLDGLLIEFDDSEIARVVICEEKATKNPRTMINSKVWPEFKEFEAGARDNELVASVTALLASSGEVDADSIVADILWSGARAYRISVTVGDTHSSVEGRKRLFKGYKATVHGAVARRRAETLHQPHFRAWIGALAGKALQAIDIAEAEHDEAVADV